MANNVMNMDGSFKPFRFWCQHVLPQVYDDSLSYMELLNKVVTYINSFGEYLEEWTAVNKLTYEGMWDITKQYPAWSIVSVNGEAGYVAIQPVPAGINYTNEDYWRMIADFTAEIMGLGERVLALENEMNTAQTDITNLQSSLNTANGRIDTANGRIDGVNALLNHNQIYDCEYAIFIGDSYTQANSLGPNQFTKRFSKVVSDALGLTEKNYGVGDTGYLYGPTPYSTQVVNAINDFETNELDKNKVKYVFVSGNRNDIKADYSWSTMANAVSTCFTTISNNFTKAKIIVTPCLWDATMAPLKMIRYGNIVIQTAQLFNNVIIVDNAHTWLTGYEDEIIWQGGANLHPNVLGHQRIANQLLNAVHGTNYCVNRNYEFTPTNLNEHVTSCNCNIRIINNVAYFTCKFTCDTDTLSGNIFEHTIGNLGLDNVMIINNGQQLFADVFTRNWVDRLPKVVLRQTLTKSDDTTGNLVTALRTYSGWKFDTTGWNLVEFAIPYGIDHMTYEPM